MVLGSWSQYLAMVIIRTLWLIQFTLITYDVILDSDSCSFSTVSTPRILGQSGHECHKGRIHSMICSLRKTQCVYTAAMLSCLLTEGMNGQMNEVKRSGCRWWWGEWWRQVTACPAQTLPRPSPCLPSLESHFLGGDCHPAPILSPSCHAEHSWAGQKEGMSLEGLP